jgi:hypothetical protein
MKFVRWIVGAILCFYGVTLVVGCIAYLASGESKTSIWVDLGLVTAFGVVPLLGGIMLLLVKPRPFAGRFFADRPPNSSPDGNGGLRAQPGSSGATGAPPSVS